MPPVNNPGTLPDADTEDDDTWPEVIEPPEEPEIPYEPDFDPPWFGWRDVP